MGRPVSFVRDVAAVGLSVMVLIAGLSWSGPAVAAVDDPGRRVTLRALAAASAAMAGQTSVAAVASPARSVASPLARPVAVLYGDSLAWEAGRSFSAALAEHPQVDVHHRTFGGTAICDWLDQMADDVERLRPGIVVVSFSGNSFTPCMADASGRPAVGDDLVGRYAADARAVTELFEGSDTEVVFAGSPIARDHIGDGAQRMTRINAEYRRLALERPWIGYVDAGASVLDDGRWTATLPCLPDEPCDGVGADGYPVATVRSPDGLHFCPVAYDAELGVVDECPVWSSGAARFGRALAQPVLERL